MLLSAGSVGGRLERCRSFPRLGGGCGDECLGGDGCTFFVLRRVGCGIGAVSGAASSGIGGFYAGEDPESFGAVDLGDGTSASVVPDVKSAGVLGGGGEVDDLDDETTGEKGNVSGGDSRQAGGGEKKVVASAGKLRKGVAKLISNAVVVETTQYPPGKSSCTRKLSPKASVRSCAVMLAAARRMATKLPWYPKAIIIILSISFRPPQSSYSVRCPLAVKTS